MRPSYKGWLVVVASVVALVLGSSSARPAAPLAGNWKVVVVNEGKDFVLAIVHVEDKDGKPEVKILWPASFKIARLDDVSLDARSFRFTLHLRGTPLHIVGYAPKGEEKPKKLLGSVHPPGHREPLILERTAQMELADKDAEKDSPGFAELDRALEEKDAGKREDALKALLKKHSGQPVALSAAEALAQTTIAGGAAADKIAPLADQYVKTAARYGREMELQAATRIARNLLSTGKNAELALTYARQAEKLLTKTDLPDEQSSALKTLTRALSKAGKAGEARTIDARLAKLEAQLDEEFEKHAIPFKLEAPPRRKRSSDRVVLLELFTGAQCPPCVAADIAFDAVLKSYKPSEVVLLQYHLHIPGPDPLTNADSEAREKFYGKAIEGTPTMFLDGKATEALGGGRDGSKESYDTLRKQLGEALKKDAGGSLTLTAARSGDKIDIEAAVADLAKSGDRVRLRFALVEEVVRYPGRNRQRLHHRVVRSFPGGVRGFALLDASAKKKVSVNLAELKKNLDEYLTRFAKDNPFPGGDWPLDLKRLKVVAFVQDETSKEVLLAGEANVPEAK